jgi:hypothetical protein
MSRGECARLSARVRAVGDLVGVSFAREMAQLEVLGLDARDLFRQTDAALTSLGEKLGSVPGTDQRYFHTDDPSSPEYSRKMNLLFPAPGERPKLGVRLFFALIELGAKVLPS